MKNVVILAVLLLLFSPGCLPSLECKVDVTKEHVYFDHCYNGLTINRLSVSDSVVTLYPRKYSKESKIELILVDSHYFEKGSKKVFFNKQTDQITWRIYRCADYDDLACFPENNNFIHKDTIQLFQPNTWYLFSFYNPTFQLFVFCDADENIRIIKEKFNTNF